MFLYGLPSGNVLLLLSMNKRVFSDHTQTLGLVFLFLILLHYCLCYAVPVFYSKWFEPRSISSSYFVIVQVSVALKKTVFLVTDVSTT